MATVYTLTGLPYAGKSTLTKALVEKFGWPVVSIDDINHERGVGEHVDTITQEDWDITYSEAYRRLEKLLEEGKNVIFDGGSLLRSERDVQKQIAERYGASTRLIYVNTPQDEIHARWSHNADQPTRGQVPEDLFKAALGMWEEPTSDENPLIYSTTMDVKEWIARNIENSSGSAESMR